MLCSGQASCLSVSFVPNNIFCKFAFDRWRASGIVIVFRQTWGAVQTVRRESESYIEFKLSLLKSNISHPGLVLHAHVHSRRVR